MLLLYILLALFVSAVSFLCTAGLVWLVCWAFALTFSWKIAFGIWIVMALVRSVFKVTVNKD